MPLSAGSKLGPYEILSQIGAGGMGEVYQARDSRLNRDVAIKVSADRFAERFEREARAVAALNHPNICSLYDVGPNYLVMELIEGPTLADRMKEGAVPLEEALGIAHQIADALEAAHERGITHRDLKPGNIKIKPGGMVKVLDFGLAKMGGTPAAKTEDSPTISMAATQAGVILGTAAYMSPEQARGKQVDKRADIWAFGMVLHEMLTGQRLFHGETISDILAGVLTKETDLSRVPAKAQRLLRKCLEKDPKHRLRDIGDAWELLEEKPASASGGKPWPWMVTAGVLFAVLAAVIALWAPWRSTPHTEQALMRLDVDLGPDVAISSKYGAGAILSPDGLRLVYVSQGKLFTRRLDQSKPTELMGAEGATGPFFSPDGRWVAFFAGGQLKKVSVEGGAAVALCNAPTSRGGSWSEDGTIVVALNTVGALSRISEAGGVAASLTELDRARAEVTHRWPQVLPGGRAVLFTAHTSTGGFDGASIDVMSLADHRRKTLVRGGTFGRYLPSGHLVYVSQGTLFAVPFNKDTLEVRGTPMPVLEEVAYSPVFGFAQFDFSQTGTLVYREGAGAERVTVQWLDNTGKSQPLLAKPGYYSYPRVSPDGNRLALQLEERANSDLWVYDWRRDTMTRLTTGGVGTTISSVWSPDGRIILFEALRGISWIRSDGASQPQILTSGKNRQVPWSFTPDGRRLAFHDVDPEKGFDLWTVPVESDGVNLRAGKQEPFLQTSSDERYSSFSPDGRWLAYSGNESGAFQIYVRAFPDKGGKWQVSTGGGVFPEWSRATHELIFRTEDNRVMAASYTVQGDSFVPDKPRVWSEKRLADVGLLRNFDLAPDGKRIAAMMPVTTPEAQSAQTHVVFLQNFFDELRRKVPPGK